MLAGWIATIYVAAALVPGPDFAYVEPPAPEPATIEEATAVGDGLTAEASATWEEPAWTRQDAAWAEPAPSGGITAEDFRAMGVVDDGEHVFTWYSQRVLPGGGLDELNANGRHVEGGFVVDGEGYIAVASCDYERGAVVDTPWGPAKVYDTGALAPGQLDVYTDF